MDNGHPVTRAELHAELNATRAELHAGLNAVKDELRVELNAFKDELTAGMRQIETNLLTAFHSYARGVSSHLHTLDAGQQDLNTRMMALEDRVLVLETRRPS